MRVLLAHVRYRERGGEDAVVDRELRILQDAGVDVGLLELRSTDFDTLTLRQRAAVAAGRGDHALGRSLMRDALDRHRPDVVHFHNVYPQLGVGAIKEAAERCATVQTLHNYRLSCLPGTHVHAGEPCTLCMAGDFRPGIARRCYRSSYSQSLAMSAALTRQLAAMRQGVPGRVVVLTEFARDWLCGLGVDPERIDVKPNSIHQEPGAVVAERSGCVYVGRLSEEKGVDALVASWPADAPLLTVVGDGPLREALGNASGTNVRFIGQVEASEVRRVLRASSVLVLSSLAWEGLPMTMLEALAEGVPVVAFHHGAMTMLAGVDERLTVPSPLTADRLVERALAVHAAGDLEALRSRCRMYARQYFSDDDNTDALLDIYQRAVVERKVMQ